MPIGDKQKHKHLASLSRLMFNGYSAGFESPTEDLRAVYPELECISALNENELAEFVHVADLHHVTVRALQVVEKAAACLEKQSLRHWCEPLLASERQRIARAIDALAPICDALDATGCKVTVIKSLDHWPDLGSDLDLYTTGDAATVGRVMCGEFKAQMEPRSWGDRLANKWNFSVPSLPELIEIHVRYLGQTGEHKAMARRVVASASSRDIRVHPGGDFLRAPLLPAAGLYGAQLLNAGRHRDLRAMCRLPLLPPLAVTALLAYRLTGSDKGVW